MAGYIAGDVDDWIYIDIADQDEDSLRFIRDCEKVIGKEIQIMRSSQYHCVDDCYRAFGGFKDARNGFAPCTNWLKKRVRKQWEWEHQNDELIYVWGFDAKEKRRAEATIEANPQAEHEFPLIDRNLSKQDVHAMLQNLGIKRPRLYDMGYPNNNCMPCCKGGAGYWNKIRIDFPELFERRVKLERELGYAMLKDKNGPLFLDTLDPHRGNMNMEIFPECGVMCYIAEAEIDDLNKEELDDTTMRKEER